MSVADRIERNEAGKSGVGVQSDLLNGPSDESGKPYRLMLKFTPVPFEFEVPATYPRIPVELALGRIAVYVTPAGFPSTMAALPSLPVVPCACTRARPLAATVKRREECIVGL